MLFTTIKKRFYVLWLVCILSSQTSIYSQAQHLSQHPGPVLLVLMEGSSGSANFYKSNESSKQRAGILDGPDSPKVSKLKTLIIEESQKAGLIRGIVNGIAILYSSLSDFVLYPALTTVLVIFVVGLILFVGFIISALKKENFNLMNKLLIFGGFHAILFINLLFILYEQRKITVMFFNFDKDILLVISSAVIGYFIGRYFSRQIFEDKALP